MILKQDTLSATGLQPKIIVSRLSLKLGGRLACSEYSYRKIGASEGHIDIIRKGYKSTWDKHSPWQRAAPHNPTISTKASNILDTEVILLLKKGAICGVAKYKKSMLIHTL